MIKRTATAILPILALTLLSGCDSSGRDKPARIDTAAIADQLRQSETGWNRAYAERNADLLAAQYASDAALANPGAPLVTGAEAIKKAVTEFASDPNLRLSFASDRIQVAESGELAYTRGHFQMRSTDPATGRPRDDNGSYLTVWRKQADGSWKAVEDFVVPGAPAGK